MITHIDGIILSDKLKEKIKYFQESNNGYIYLDKLDELLDNSIATVGDNLQMQMDNICVIREMYKLLKCITETGKEIDHD